MSNTISEVLIRIIKTYSNNNDLINTLYILLNSEVLNKKERLLCEAILEKLELLNMFDLSNVVKEIDPTIDVSDYDGYELDEVMNKIDDFTNYKKQIIFNQFRDKAYKNVVNKNYDKETIDFIYNSFPEIISIKEDTSLEDLYEITDSNEGISTGYYCLDSYLKGLHGGDITTIVGSEVSHKSILCLNIAYNILCSGKNILYFSIGTKKKDIYKKLLIRHSCSNNMFKKLELDRSYVRDKGYERIHNDFLLNYSDSIIVVDESDFYISTYYSMLKLLCAYDNKFRKRTGNGIDIIFIDILSSMKLFDGKKYVTNRNTVASQIITLLKSQATNLLASGKSIPIVVTYETNIYNPLNIRNSIPDIVSCLSDNIVIVANSDTDEPLSRMVIQIFKSTNGTIMDSNMDICCDYKHWHIFDKESNVFPDSKQALEYAKKQNNSFSSISLLDLEESISMEKNTEDIMEKNTEDIKLEF